MTDRERKKAAVKALEADFIKRFRVIITPIVASIKKELSSGKSADEAVDTAFKRHDLRGRLKTHVVNAAVKAVKYG